MSRIQTPLDSKECRLLALLREEGPLSRRELHEQTGLRPNTIGTVVARMIHRGLIREGDSEAVGPGRPRVPLSIDPSRQRVFGLNLEPGKVMLSQLNLNGERVSQTTSKELSPDQNMVSGACELLADAATQSPLVMGISITGFVDPQTYEVLLSSTIPGDVSASLKPIYDAVACPIILENDMHALAAQWLLTHNIDQSEDVLMVLIRDGAIGAALLVNGKPNRGCVVGSNELGHTRFCVETKPCYCGHSGCLERIFSTDFLHQCDSGSETLFDRIAAFDGHDECLSKVMRYLSMGLANSINLIRPNRLVLVSELTQHGEFKDNLIKSIRSQLLDPLTDRVSIEFWDNPLVGFGESAGWLALATLFMDGWEAAQHTRPYRFS